VGRDCQGFYHGFAKDSVGIRFHLGNCESIDQGSSLYTYQDGLLRTAASRVVYVDDSLSTWSAKKIVSDRGTQFTLKFWERLLATLDTQLSFSFAYHPQTDRQTEREN
jgi:transposase InsO family protein